MYTDSRDSHPPVQPPTPPTPTKTNLTTAIAAMAELGYDLAAHASKSLDEVKEHAPFDAVVTMGACVSGWMDYWILLYGVRA